MKKNETLVLSKKGIREDRREVGRERKGREGGMGLPYGGQSAVAPFQTSNSNTIVSTHNTFGYSHSKRFRYYFWFVSPLASSKNCGLGSSLFFDSFYSTAFHLTNYFVLHIYSICSCLFRFHLVAGTRQYILPPLPRHKRIASGGRRKKEEQKTILCTL